MRATVRCFQARSSWPAAVAVGSHRTWPTRGRRPLSFKLSHRSGQPSFSSIWPIPHASRPRNSGWRPAPAEPHKCSTNAGTSRGLPQVLASQMAGSAATRPSLHEAMFQLPIDTRFAQDAEPGLRSAFNALAPHPAVTTTERQPIPLTIRARVFRRACARVGCGGLSLAGRLLVLIVLHAVEPSCRRDGDEGQSGRLTPIDSGFPRENGS